MPAIIDNELNWEARKSVNGYVVRGKGEYASNSIFLPCAGAGFGTTLYSSGSDSYYWSSVPDSVDYSSWSLIFDADCPITSDYNDRANGSSVRPVQGFLCL